MAWILAADVGTTTLKLGAVAPDGRLLGLVRHEYDLDTPGPDRIELGPDVYWSFYRDGVRRLLTQAEVEPSGLRGIGLSSQATTFLCRDAQDQPLGPFIVWLDTRAGREADEIRQHFGDEEIFRRTGHTQFVGLVAAGKMRWLGRHKPDLLAHTQRIYWAEDDLIYRLTGQHATDPVLAGASGLYDMRQEQWWPEMVAFVGLRTDQLPRVVPAGQVVAPIRAHVADELGLPHDVPVVSGTNDQLAGAISVGNVHPGIVTETTGTALALVTTLDRPLDDLAAGVPFWGHPAPGRFSVLVYTNTATIVLKWFREQFCPNRTYAQIMDEVARIPIGADGVTFFPHFTGTGSPDFTTGARGEIDGLALRHTKFHVARALIESLTFSLKDLSTVAARVAGPPDVIRSLGGGARSDLWLQMKADALQVPVEKPDCEEPALVGAGLLGAVGAGLFPSIEAGAAAMSRVTRRFEPNPAASDAYREAYERYRALYERVCAAARHRGEESSAS